MARTLVEPDDWASFRLVVMETLLWDRFWRHSDLWERLIATDLLHLVNELPNPGPESLFWGKFQGEGQNHLGRILESIRGDINNGIDMDQWIVSTFKIQDNRKAIPDIHLSVEKDGAQIEEIDLQGKPIFMFGQLADKCDV